MNLSEDEIEELKALFIEGFAPVIEAEHDELLMFAYWIVENSTLDHDRQSHFIDTLHTYDNDELKVFIEEQRLNLQSMIHHKGRFRVKDYARKYRIK